MRTILFVYTGDSSQNWNRGGWTWTQANDGWIRVDGRGQGWKECINVDPVVFFNSLICKTALYS